MSASAPDRVRKYLSIDSLIQGLRERFEAIPDARRAASVEHSQADCLMSAFAMFSLKEPSLLAFDQRRQDQSLMNLYRIKSIPSDSQHREILDDVEPIIRQDGNNMNDCERNAVRRLLKLVRKMHPKQKCIVIEDGLASNGPHIRDLIDMNFQFLLGAKPDDHTYLLKIFSR